MNRDELLARLKPEMVKIDETMAEDLADIVDPTLREIIHHGIFNGGKRVRPLLTLLAANLCGGEINRDAYRLSMSFEYLHAASLLHDDVIDHAEQRRGKPSANTIWGNSDVILAGDYLHTRAMTLAGTVGSPEILSVIGKATTSMVEAEFLQAKTAQEIDRSVDNYFSVLAGKTGALISSPCETGALFAKASDNQRQALYNYGMALGLAFQVVDDLLDYQGDPAKTGKAVGNDFQEGKMTLPLLHALDQADDAQRDQLLDLLAASPEKRQSEVATAHDIIEANKGFAHARAKAETLVTEACEALSCFPDNDAKNMLLGLGQYVLTRQK
ncbi:MAG: polyprenyl synthetase family protein [Desulfobulbaceae bacterium]|nr:polyprenyl synthetase family protein [Desulfobulbaceae bacterium]